MFEQLADRSWLLRTSFFLLLTHALSSLVISMILFTTGLICIDKFEHFDQIIAIVALDHCERAADVCASHQSNFNLRHRLSWRLHILSIPRIQLSYISSNIYTHSFF